MKYIFLFEYKKYKNIFFIKKINRLLLYRKNNYTIEIINNLFYKFLYNLLNIKLTVFKIYFNNILIKR